jgi:hypothetical protein
VDGIPVISNNQKIHCECSLGQGTRNYAKIKAATILMAIVCEQGINYINIYGDSNISGGAADSEPAWQHSEKSGPAWQHSTSI